ncbi:hypothetical protein D3C83_54920 [compost metagenome]
MRRARTLPLTCTGTTISSALAASALNAGHSAATSPVSWPRRSQSSSAVWGAKGASMRTSASIASRMTHTVCMRSLWPACSTSSSLRRDGPPVTVFSLKL